MPTFEIGIYNKEVRELISMGEHHKNLSDSWENIHYVEVFASDEDDARRKAQSKYPHEHGYVIEQVSRVDYG